jgi:hypothetical protein
MAAPMTRGPGPRKARFLEGVRGPLLAAVVLTFLVDLALVPPESWLHVIVRLFGFAIAATLQVGFGMWLGRRSWPKRGRRLARRLVKRAFREDVRPLVFLSDRPDFEPHLGRRVLEVLGFAAGASVVLAAVLPFLGLASWNVFALAGTLTLFTLWASFILVPYWLFARMGLRQVDPVRWLVQPMSRRYADRLRLSNGALLLVALGASVNLAFRAGASGEVALVDGIQGLVRLVASILLVAASAAVFYAQRERALVKEFEEEVLAYGVRDARGMSDGDFLPRLPHPTPPKPPVQELPPLLHEYRPPPP